MAELAYLVTLVLCVLASVDVLKGRRRRQATLREAFWPAVTLVVLALVVSKALDVQFLADQEGRRALWISGLYGDRREIQGWIILAVAIAGSVLFLLTALWFRDPAYLLPLAAVSALCVFIVIRALSLHQVDAVLYNRHYLGLHFSDFAETGLVLGVGLSALLFHASRSPRRRSRLEREGI